MHLKACIMKVLQILKHSFKGPSVLFRSNVCHKKSSLLHTGDNTPASDFFLGGVYLFYYFPQTAARARASGEFFGIYVYIFQQFLYTEQQTLLKA